LVDCRRCGNQKAVGHIKTTSPTGSFSKDYDVCMTCILKIEAWLENKKDERQMKLASD
jgi:hypothetical protein